MKKKQIMNIIILCFAFAIICISLAYAALSSKLTVTGQATVSGNWNVLFENLCDRPTIVGTPNIKDANLSTTEFRLNVELTKPLDSVTYTFDVRNAGTIDAKVVKVIVPDLDVFVANHLTYSFTYADGSEIKANDVLPGNCSNSNTVNCTRNLKLSVTFNDVNQLEQNPMNFSLDTSILYKQA